MKVIIADDSTTIRRILQGMLAKIGHTDILIAGDGEAVIELLRENPDVGLVLMDWSMPAMNGLECLRAIRVNPDTSHIAVVMITSEAMLSRIMEAKEAGATAYLIKPFSPEKFFEVVGGILGPGTTG